MTDDEGRMKPFRGKRGTKGGATRHQVRRNETSAISMKGGLCLGKRKRCVENGGSHIVKRKRGIPEDVWGQAGQEGVGQDEAVTRAVNDTEAGDVDTDVGMEVRSTAREHGKQGRNKERVMGSPMDRRMSAYSEENDDTREEPMEGTRRAERVGTSRCSG